MRSLAIAATGLLLFGCAVKQPPRVATACSSFVDAVTTELARPAAERPSDEWFAYANEHARQCSAEDRAGGRTSAQGDAQTQAQHQREMFTLPMPTRPAAAESIQLERQGGVYMLPVRINEAITLNFVLDSGAADVAIPEDVFLTLTRTHTVKKSDFIGPGTYVLANGSRQPSERFVLHELRVGDHIIRNVVANVAPVRGDPLLGQSFLSKLPAWTIENERHAFVVDRDERHSEK